MTYAQRQQHRELYQQLRLNLAFPGEVIGGERKPYAPVNKDEWTFDYMLTQPNTPRIAYLQARYPLAGLASLGMRG